MGQVWPNRKMSPNKVLFIEFANPISVDRALKIRPFINGKKINVKRAGSGTYMYAKSRKNKIRAMPENEVFNIGNGRQGAMFNVPATTYRTYTLSLTIVER